MNYPSLILMVNNKFYRILWFFFLIPLFLVSGCSSREYPRPTEAYYINDYAEALDSGTHSFLRRLGEDLYNSTENTEIGGTQIVVATFEVDTISNVSDYDMTNLYREWQIGENDLGLLVVLYFETRESLVEEPVLLAVDTEVGYRMEPYLTPTRLGNLLDETIFNTTLYADEWMYPIDIPLAHFMFEVHNLVLVEVYDDEPYDYDLEEHRTYLDNHVYDGEYYSVPSEWWIYFLLTVLSGSPDWSMLGWIGIVFFLSGGLGVFIFKGAGGSSGGAGVFRRRR